jgi:hypothetical protein
LRKKPGGALRCASLTKARGAIQNQLSTELLLLCVSFRDDGVGEGVTDSVITPDDNAAAVVHEDRVSSDNDNYHPTPKKSE